MKFRQEPEVILSELGIYEPEDIDLDFISYSLNADVRRTSLTDCEGNIVGTNEKAIITINSDAELSRQRFSLGHELGHWVNDRGKNLTYRCHASDMRQRTEQKGNFKQHREVRANQFAAQLLMPSYIFSRYQSGLDITVETVNFLAERFNASRTSTAIRLVESSDLPCILICWSLTGNRKWFIRNPIIPDRIWPHKTLLKPACIGDEDSNDIEVDSDKWIDGHSAEDYTVKESTFSNGYDYLTLLWWQDESQLIHI